MKKIKNNTYDHTAIELKWQSVWGKERTYQPDLNSAKEKFYNLMMFPYPSAEGLHVGSMYTFSGVDVYGRFKRMQGYEVFEPIGLDGFGIHSENHAIKTGTHPVEHAKTTEENFYRQLKEIGNGFAWEQKLETYDSAYYKWTQWIFVQLFKMGLAYRKKAPVNFCPSCKTVLADEQVIDGKCERCGSVVEKRDLEQWFFKITQYADRLLDNIKDLDWTEKIKIAQREWIGRSEGAKIRFKIEDLRFKNKDVIDIEVFTTAIDTIYGVTFMVLAPEHPLIKSLIKGDLGIGTETIEKVKDYVEKAGKKSEQDRMADVREKTGVSTDLFVINPFNNEKVPVWVADYVLSGYGTGAVMAVPGHDARDHELALRFGLPIKVVVRPIKDVKDAKVGKDGFWDYPEIKTKFKEKSVLFDSGEFDGLTSIKAKQKMFDYIEKEGFGERTKTYHLRDWLISRQRYWGPPIPMLFCPSCKERGESWFTMEEGKGWQESRIKNQESRKEKIGSANWAEEIGNSSEAMAGWYPEENLPVELPYIKDFKPLGIHSAGSGQEAKGPLANHPEFYEAKCPECGGKARRETDVSDTFLDSSWYFLRYLAADWDDMPFPSVEFAKSKKQKAKSKEEIENWNLKIENSTHRAAWLPVTMYIGGAEHAVLHLLYARFISMAVHDLGLTDFEEPFKKFYAHGLVIKDGVKMSKSKGNVVNPDIYIKKYGADTLRVYLRFLGPFDQTGDFRDSGVEGMHRFLKRVWKLFQKDGISNLKSQISNERLHEMHETIKGVTGDMEDLRFNTAIAKLMTWYNFLAKQDQVSFEEAEAYLKLLAPFAPHMAEEIWQFLQRSMINDLGLKNNEKDQKSYLLNLKSIHTSSWPEFNEKYLVSESVTIAVQVNGKLRATLEVLTDDAKDQKKIEEMAKKDKNVAKFIENGIKKSIYIPNKILNFVV